MQFKAHAEKLTNFLVKAIQTDGGPEFKPLKEYFKKKGLIIELLVSTHRSKMD